MIATDVDTVILKCLGNKNCNKTTTNTKNANSAHYSWH